MNKATQKILSKLAEYVAVMKRKGITPSALYVTHKQFLELNNAYTTKTKEWDHRLHGLEVKETQ